MRFVKLGRYHCNIAKPNEEHGILFIANSTMIFVISSHYSHMSVKATVTVKVGE